MSLLSKMRGDREGWYKVSDLRPGVEIATPSENGGILWDEIVSIQPVGREQVWDIEVAGTHNFVGNGIFAHNTYVLRANTKLVVEGEMNAESVIVPVPDAATLPAASSTLIAQLPPEILTADGLGVDLYKLSTYNLAVTQGLATRMDADEVHLASLEDRVAKLESGAVSSATNSPIALGSESLASALNAFGAYISKGIAQFGSLVADQFVAATNSAGTSSAGTVTILAGNTVASVTNAYVTPSTKIFVTSTASTTGTWYVSDKQNGSFRLVLEAAQAADTSFDYFLVQTQGQIATSTPEVGGSQTSGTSSTAPVITMLGDSTVHLSIGSVFVEPGVQAVDAVDGGVAVDTYIDGVKEQISSTTIDTSSAATYTITYKATNSVGGTATATRTVIVDAADGSQGSTGIQGSTSDQSSQDQTSNASSTPASIDKVAPVVTLTGAAAMEVVEGQTFTDPGATAADETDGDLTNHINVSGTVDSATLGLYTLTYSATDKAGNVGTVSRVVTVIAAPAPAASPDVTASSTPSI